MIGHKFGRLEVIEDKGSDIYNRRVWKCKCECGNFHTTLGTYLRTGTTKSCGCLRKDRMANYRHGHHRAGAQTRAYTSWVNMKNRCTNPNLPQWQDWGGRGISFDPRWDFFQNFLDDMGEPPPGTSLDRYPDNDGNYCKENCRWATRDQQRRNNRQLHWVEYNGEKMCLRDWCAKTGKTPKDYANIISRIHRGSPLEFAMNPTLWRGGRKKKVA